MAVTNVLIPKPKPCLSARQGLICVVAVVTVSVVAGFGLIERASEARARKVYEGRVEDLRPVGDPIAGRLYPYQVVGVDTYELCRRLSTQFRRF